MAIPFHIPSDEETAHSYRSLDELLWQLCDVLRQILLHRPATTTARDEARTTGPDVVPDVVPRLPLPDLLEACPRRPQRRHEVPAVPPRRQRRRRQHKPAPDVDETPPTPPPPPITAAAATYRVEAEDRKPEMRDNWTQVGEDLRKIADDFHVSLQSLEQQKSLPSNKGVSLVSLLVPHGPLWMAVIVLLGWGALQRAR